MPKKELLFSVIQGTGIPVIMLHGLTASHHDWDSLTPEVTQAGYRVYAPDLLGHGDSPRPANPAIYNLDNLYHSLLDWIEQVHIPKPFFLIGHSLGGYLCLKIAIDQPNHVLGLVLVAPFYTLNQIFPLARQALQVPRLSEQVIRMAKPQMVYTVLSLTEAVLGKYPPQVRWQTAIDYTRAVPASMRFPASASDLTPHLASIKAPVITLWGNNDLMLRPHYFKFLVNTLPHAQGYAFPSCGHEPHLACIPQFNQLALRFLKAHTYEDQNRAA